MAKIISDSPTMKAPKGSSAQTHVPVGSGSRPGKSKINIETSAPSNSKTLGRDVAGSLK